MNKETQENSLLKNGSGALLELLKPIQKYLDDDFITEISINKPYEIFVENIKKGYIKHSAPDLSYKNLYRLCIVIANFNSGNIDKQNPTLSGILPNNERVQCIMPPAILPNTISISIRKPSKRLIPLSKYVKDNLLANINHIRYQFKNYTDIDKSLLSKIKIELLDLLEKKKYYTFLVKAVRSKQNIIISGGTSSGKTTFGRAILNEVDLKERLITIEDVHEMMLPHENVVNMLFARNAEQSLSKASSNDIFISTLRMNPERIIPAELRADEIYDYIMAVNSGHPGSISTIHANSAKLTFTSMVMKIKSSDAGKSFSKDEIMDMLLSTIEIVIYCSLENGVRKPVEIYFDPVAQNKALG